MNFDSYVRANWNSPGCAASFDDLKLAPPCPEPWRSLLIAVCGAAGEMGEMLEHVKKFVRDGEFNGHEFLLEAGDAHHYWVRIITMFGLSTKLIEEMNRDKLDRRRWERWVKGNGGEGRIKAAMHKAYAAERKAVSLTDEFGNEWRPASEVEVQLADPYFINPVHDDRGYN